MIHRLEFYLHRHPNTGELYESYGGVSSLDYSNQMRNQMLLSRHWHVVPELKVRRVSQISQPRLSDLPRGTRRNLLVARMQEKIWAPHSTNYVLEYVLDSSSNPDPLHMQTLLLSGRTLGELLTDHYPGILDDA